jgi:hypothetical protein
MVYGVFEGLVEAQNGTPATVPKVVEPCASF